jgi:hypothetical protein
MVDAVYYPPSERRGRRNREWAMSDGSVWVVAGAAIGALGTIGSTLANSWLAKPKVDPVRENRKALLNKLLTDNLPDWTWRSLGVLGHTIGASEDETKSLLIEIGAQASEDGRDMWALMSVLKEQGEKQKIQ